MQNGEPGEPGKHGEHGTSTRGGRGGTGGVGGRGGQTGGVGGAGGMTTLRERLSQPSRTVFVSLVDLLGGISAIALLIWVFGQGP